MILVLHDVIDIVLLLEGKPMGAAERFYVQESLIANLFDLVMLSLMFLYCNRFSSLMCCYINC